MKLLPLIGIDELRFGDHATTVRAAMGEQTEVRASSLPIPHTTFPYGSLALGFDADDRLNFISVGNDVESAELWGEQPFIVAHRSPAVLGTRLTSSDQQEKLNGSNRGEFVFSMKNQFTAMIQKE